MEVGAYEAKTHLPALLERVEQGEEITITKHGRAVARLVPVARTTNERRQAAIDRLKELRKGQTLGCSAQAVAIERRPSMTDFVLDSSVTFSWFFEDERSPATDQLLERLETETAAAVPSVWYLEVSNTLALAERRGRITLADSAGIYGDLLEGLDDRHGW